MAWFTSWWAHKDAEDSAGSSYLHANYKHYRQLIRQGPTTMANESPEDLEWGNTTSRVLTHPVLWRWEVFFIFFLFDEDWEIYVYLSFFQKLSFPANLLAAFSYVPSYIYISFLFLFFYFFFPFCKSSCSIVRATRPDTGRRKRSHLSDCHTEFTTL